LDSARIRAGLRHVPGECEGNSEGSPERYQSGNSSHDHATDRRGNFWDHLDRALCAKAGSGE